MTPSELNFGAKIFPSSTNSIEERSAKFTFLTFFPLKLLHFIRTQYVKLISIAFSYMQFFDKIIHINATQFKSRESI